MNYLYEDFLYDQTTYLQNEAFYKNLFTEIVGEEPVDYYTTHFNNGQKFFDGNPIFNTKKNNRLIRIIQDEPESEKPYLNARIEKKEDTLEELIINLELSEEIKPILETYLKKWFKEMISISEMDKLLKTYSIQEELDSTIVSESQTVYHNRRTIDYSGKVSRYDQKIKIYILALEKREIKIHLPLLHAITRYCGSTIYNRNTARIAASNPLELKNVKNNFLIKKLGLKNSPQLDIAINEVIQKLGKGNKHKYRAMFYYLLVKKFHKESIFLK